MWGGVCIVPSIRVLLPFPSPGPSHGAAPLPQRDTRVFDMANIKSQEKRNRQNEKRRMRNKSIMSDLKTSVRRLEEAAAAGEPTDELYRSAQSKIDAAASKGVIKKNAAARKKSRLSSKVG